MNSNSNIIWNLEFEVTPWLTDRGILSVSCVTSGQILLVVELVNLFVIQVIENQAMVWVELVGIIPVLVIKYHFCLVLILMLTGPNMDLHSFFKLS